MFDKTQARVREAMEIKITQPIRNIWLIAVAALITAVIGILIAVRR